MYKSADLTDGVEESGTRLVVCDVNETDVGIILQCLLNNTEVRSLVYRELEIDVRKSVELTDLNRTC